MHDVRHSADPPAAIEYGIIARVFDPNVCFRGTAA